MRPTRREVSQREVRLCVSYVCASEEEPCAPQGGAPLRSALRTALLRAGETDLTKKWDAP